MERERKDEDMKKGEKKEEEEGLEDKRTGGKRFLPQRRRERGRGSKDEKKRQLRTGVIRTKRERGENGRAGRQQLFMLQRREFPVLHF